MIDIDHLRSTIGPSISGQRAFRDLLQICNYHRIQVSPGLTDAAHYCCDRLREAHLNVELFRYPADGYQTYYDCRPPAAWHSRAATLDVVSPDQRRIADYTAAATCLVSRSAPTNGPVELDLVAVEQGDRADHYSELDVSGKIVLARGPVGAVYEYAVVRGGAAGFILDSIPDIPPVRQAPDLPDAHNDWTFPMSVLKPACFGFSISLRTGMWLRSLAAAGPVRLRAEVDTAFADGTIDIVSGSIQGMTDEEVLIIAHICHPAPSANDNGSGVAALMEAMRNLASLIRRGELPVPRRTIRCLLVPEVTGTYVFLARNPGFAGQCVAALNLDMVGEDQSQCGSSLLVEYPPRAQPSFTGALLATITEQVIAGASTPIGSATYPAHRYNEVPFSGGSDHLVLSHPRVGIPCPMLIQWPDRFYHTSEDTPDRVDPSMLATAATIAAIYGFALADADRSMALALAHEITARFPAELNRAVGPRLARLYSVLSKDNPDMDRVAVDLDRLIRTIGFMSDRAICDLHSVGRLVGDSGRQILLADLDPLIEQVQTLAEVERRRATLLCGQPGTGRADPPPPAADRIIRQVHPGPVHTLATTDNVSEERRRQIRDFAIKFQERLGLLGPVVCFWLDGVRTLREAIELAELETGLRDDEAVLELMSILLELGLAVEQDKSTDGEN